MQRGIVITTSSQTKSWLPECLQSVKNSPYTIVIQDNGASGGFELAGIQKGKELFDEFIHLMDTTVVKDISLFDKLFEMEGHVFLTNGGYHFMGKFVSDDLPDIPEVRFKEEAIALELHWLKGKKKSYFLPDLPVHTEVFEEKHGRKNMVLSNAFITKWKATWSI
jgi:hypothetical protein